MNRHRFSVRAREVTLAVAVAVAVGAGAGACGGGGASGPPVGGSGGGGGSGGTGAGGTGGGRGADPGFLAGVTALSSGFSHTCAVLSGGDVACWGGNGFGALGSGPVPSSQPLVITGISGAISVSSGRGFSCAVLQDHTARCWGVDTNGQLGGGTASAGALDLSAGGYPVAVQGLAGVTAVSAGDDFACALAGGEVWCWGSNIWDELGTNGVPMSSNTPLKIPGLSGITAIFAAPRHACALSGGSVWCWGSNAFGESGGANRPPGSDRIATPVQVIRLSNVTAIAGTLDFTYAVLADGTVVRWGGSNALTSPTVPSALVNFSNVKELAISDRICALLTDGSVTCTDINAFTPAPVVGLSGVRSITGSGGFKCGLVDGGAVKCWGLNTQGELGNGTIDYSAGGVLETTVPTAVVAPCCGSGMGAFSSGLPGPTLVKDLSAAEFQQLCRKVRDDTDGLQQYCQVLAVAGAAGAPDTTSDTDLKSLCQTAFDSCWPVTAQFSSATCPSVVASATCTMHIDQVAACMNEQTALGKANGPALPACSALTRSAIQALPPLALVLAPTCQKIYSTCNQIFFSP